jgi:hypothetical protein
MRHTANIQIKNTQKKIKRKRTMKLFKNSPRQNMRNLKRGYIILYFEINLKQKTKRNKGKNTSMNTFL